MMDINLMGMLFAAFMLGVVLGIMLTQND